MYRVDLAERRPALNLVAVGPVLFLEIVGQLTPGDVDAMPRFHQAMRRADQSAVITLVHRVGLPDAETRARAAEAMRHIQPGTTRVVALLAGGLFASAARSVLTGLYVVSGGRHLHNIVTNVDDAKVVVAGGLGVSKDVVDRVYDTFCAWSGAPYSSSSSA